MALVSRAQKDIVINAFKGHCISIFRVIYGARILEVAYNDWASADQRNFIVSEFYGPEFVIFRVSPFFVESMIKNII